MRTTFAASPRRLAGVLDAAELRLHAFAARHALTLLRLSLGFVFLLFGFLKFFPNLSPAQAVAEDTTHKLFLGLFPDAVNLRIVAVVEVTAGICLLSNRFIRPAAVLLLVEMAGILSPLVLIPGQLFAGPHGLPNLLGQYILKDFVLLAAVLVLLATQRGGTIILGPDATAAEEAARRTKEERSARAAHDPAHGRSGTGRRRPAGSVDGPTLRQRPAGPAPVAGFAATSDAPSSATAGPVVERCGPQPRAAGAPLHATPVAAVPAAAVPSPDAAAYPAIRRDPARCFEVRARTPADDPGVTVRSTAQPRWRRWAPVAVGVGVVLGGRRMPGGH